MLSAGGIALLLMASDPRRNWNQLLSLFLLLISLNFLAQVFDWTLGESFGLFSGSRRMWRGIGAITFIMDPAVLAYFTSIFPRRTAFARNWWATLLLGYVTCLFLFFELERGFLSTSAQEAFLTVAFYVWAATLYTFSVWRLVMNHAQEPSRIMARQVHIIAIGVMIAIIPRLALIPWDLRKFWPALLGLDQWNTVLVTLAFYLLIMWSVFGFMLFASRWRTNQPNSPSIRSVGTGFAIVGIILAMFSLYMITNLLAQGHPAFEGLRALDPFQTPLWFYIMSSNSFPYAMRWVVFSALVFYGVLRFQALAVRPRMIRMGLMATGLVVVIASGGLLTTVLGPWLGGSATAAVAVGGGVGIYHQLNRKDQHVPSYLRERALDAYRSNLAAAFADGIITADEADHLQRIRKRLGISRREHESLLRIAEVEEARSHERPLLFGRYEEIRRVGAGGYGTVYLARDSQTDDLVAVKKYHVGAGNRQAAEAVQRELKVAQRVSHPNLIAIHDILMTPDGPASVFEFAEGGSLREYLLQERVLASAEVKRIASQVLEGLQALHEAGLVHGDLKPENVLLDALGNVKLADFGSAGRPGTQRGNVTAAITAPGPGTALYQAPEVRSGSGPTPRADLYAVGMVVVEALTGIHPDREGGTPLAPSEIDDPAGWDIFLMKALAQNPSRRYSSAAEMRSDLDNVSVLDETMGRDMPLGTAKDARTLS